MPTIQTIFPWLTSSYAMAIYLYGTRRFTARDGYSGIPTSYHEPVKLYAATNYSMSQINNALMDGYINETEYNETLAYME